ncbi:hypothetical protein HO173_000136 [Letharia columbiana]|uniref:Uncharacterized protein n=1 Tax=Letharia columbiana TaxID=112416 RepID=A0A8H6G6H2_9LECA|nr:uncharacterized protein HO173_000136 [Letharia columbiana]KAF6241426.1 hypothetical protein HO173_000136 [Letharia columbiana]
MPLDVHPEQNAARKKKRAFALLTEDPDFPAASSCICSSRHQIYLDTLSRNDRSIDHLNTEQTCFEPNEGGPKAIPVVHSFGVSLAKTVVA